MPLTKQQDKIYQHMSEQSATRSYIEMAKELKIKPPSFRTQLTRLKDLELVKPTDPPENRHWVITSPAAEKAIRETKEAAEKSVKESVNRTVSRTVSRTVKENEANEEAVNETVNETEEGKKPAPSRESEGQTERQIFEQKARAIGNMQPEKLTVITDMVWEGDPHNLDEVWHSLNQTNLPIDVKRMLFSSWRSWLKLQRMPTDISEATERQVTPPVVPNEKGVKGKEETGPRDYIVDRGEIVKVASGTGDFTFEQAKDTRALDVQEKRWGSKSEGSRNGEELKGSALAETIKALTPFLNKDTDQTMLTELLKTRNEKMFLELQALIPQPPKEQPKPQSLFDQLKDLKEIMALLGFGQQSQNPGPVTTASPVQIMGADGKPMVMDLSTLLAVKKFEVEERREEAEEKRREKKSNAMTDFMGKIGSAVSRVAGG